MTMEPADGPSQKFSRVYLPWAVCGAFGALFLFTLNRWVSLNNWGAATFFTSSNGLFQTARLGGWVWQPQIYEPLYWLLTWPAHWLSPRYIPIALNLFSALCAAVALALLARSVALLPHDRTDVQRQKAHGPDALLGIPTAWLPPLFAVLVCGLQLTFWEHATAASGEMLDLLLFAYIIRNLLEFRLDANDRWLLRAAFVYGLGITNNWAMIGFFLLFLTALIWIRGLSFFDVRFLVRMFCCGLAGLLLYLLLPIIRSAADVGNVPFWSALRLNLGGEKAVLSLLFRIGRGGLLLMSLTSLIPILVISSRWTSYFGDTSRLGVALAKLMFHVVHGLFFIACLWVALDPSFSPRNRGLEIRGHDDRTLYLTFYYLGALTIGYCAGYFLLLFRNETGSAQKRGPALSRVLNRLVVGAVWVLFLLVPAALVVRNLPQIHLGNGRILQQHASALARSLPPKAVLLSDDLRRLLLVQANLAASGRLRDYICVDTALLPFPDYHRFLRKKYGKQWPVEMPKGQRQVVSDLSLLQLLINLSQSNKVCYLHPSFGYYFEAFYMEPHGLVYQLRTYPTNMLVTPPLPPEVIHENQAFWGDETEHVLPELLAGLPGTKPKDPLVARLFVLARLKPEQNEDAHLVANFCSRALNYWGTEMQRNNRLAEAEPWFATSHKLNPDNIVAAINLECNQNLQAGRKSGVQLTKAVTDEFGEKYRNWEQVLNANGPFDEPRFCFEQGKAFADGGNLRQAASQFDRVRNLAPDNIAARVFLARLYVIEKMPDGALSTLEQIKKQPEFATVTNRIDLDLLEAAAWLTKKDIPAAEKVLNNMLAEEPRNEPLLAAAAQTYMNYGAYSNALDVVGKALQLSPTNVSALINEGYLHIQLEQFEAAIPPLTKALGIETNNYSALLNRAIANLRLGNLDDARRDYETLQKSRPTEFRIYYGLGEIAYRKMDTNAAIRNYELYLTNNPPDAVEVQMVKERLKELKPPRR